MYAFAKLGHTLANNSEGDEGAKKLRVDLKENGLKVDIKRHFKHIKAKYEHAVTCGYNVYFTPIIQEQT
ncbi:hypothetical protein TNCV_1679141 [Trichonephila clavipes]|nr:hypothetical protein TNCV_1679141 [Trichonephila clavipes]